jgi:hypothetical protein
MSLSEKGNVMAARKKFQRAVELSPHEGYAKYMSLAQIYEGDESVKYFTKVKPSISLSGGRSLSPGLVNLAILLSLDALWLTSRAGDDSPQGAEHGAPPLKSSKKDFFSDFTSNIGGAILARWGPR